ncbi:MAG: type 4b pilus protein PilO2 [Paludibacterium sp.]|uniref:type 4b pilus protein PilO2 n=1 Tax=Paludibacterium sp. TaxID=1917523 RepID=UPI0025E81DC9|nr:type 4b pilus protein PilO2 [Paludibacterium sp.]MBV8046448.1 type 4b pilus protein PilO2 [Paludibacterium sp.]MBV8645840.1 type 4b pilus protein PilO2 [Paludibacterium sp.]
MDQYETPTHRPQAMQGLIGVVKLGRRHYAASLIWNHTENDKTLAAEAREAAARVGAELIAVRSAPVAQYGLGDVMLGHKPGQPSLAAALAEASQSAIYGVWPLPGQGWCLLGVRGDGSVAYDKCTHSESAIRDAFFDGLVAEVWDQVICPADWQVEGSTAAEALAPRLAATKVKLRPLKVDTLRWLLYGGAAVLALGGAGYGYQQWQAQQAAHIARAPRPSLPAPPPMPWAGQPLPGAALATCVDSILAHRLDAASLPVWRLSAARCDGREAGFQLRRQHGSPHWAADAAQRAWPSATLAINGDSARLSWPLPALPHYPANGAGVSLMAARRYLQNQFDELQLPIKLSDGDRQPWWNGLKYEIETPFDPARLLPILSRLPASVVTEVRLVPGEKTRWVVEGQVFERRQPSPEEIQALQPSERSS